MGRSILFRIDKGVVDRVGWVVVGVKSLPSRDGRASSKWKTETTTRFGG